MIIDAELDVCPSFGWNGGPEFSTLIKMLRSGHERRRPLWEVVRHHYMLPIMNIRDPAYLQRLKAVFLVARGAAHSFWVKDYSDFQADNETFGVGDGVETEFDLFVTSTFGGESYSRQIMRAIDGVFRVNGVPAAATFNGTTRKVVFDVAPADESVLSWSGEFRVLVRFATDTFPMTIDNRMGDDYAMNGTVELREVFE